MILNGKVQSNAEVLIDPEGFNWLAQRHDLDPAYAGVKLVVTWRGQKPDFESPEYVRMDQYWSDSWMPGGMKTSFFSNTWIFTIYRKPVMRH